MPAPAITAADGTPVVCALVGCAGDPQGLDHQERALTGAGAVVIRGAAAAARVVEGAR